MSFLENQDNRRGLAVAIIGATILFGALDRHIPIIERFFNSNLQGIELFAYAMLFLPCMFLIGKHYKAKNLKFFCSIGWIIGICYYRLTKTVWDFNYYYDSYEISSGSARISTNNILYKATGDVKAAMFFDHNLKIYSIYILYGLLGAFILGIISYLIYGKQDR